MPRQTDRQALTNKLLELFVLQTLAEGQAALLKLLDTDSETSASESEDPLLPQLSSTFLSLLTELHSTQYLQDRIHIPKNAEHPALFRSLLRVTPSTFDALLSKIQDHAKQQLPVNQQLAVVLYRLGHYGNAASMQKVGLWAGFGYGTVDKCTWWVLTAVCDEGFRWVVMRWPSEIQKAEASSWVESCSCSGWRGGWLMVDGTLVPLFARPGFYGNSWYDQKSNYSLNVQLISMPNLRIIDYGVGLPDSQHDAMAWKGTRIPQEHEQLLGRDEWVWADTAYPLQTWCQAPYKKFIRPDKDLPENAKYNYYVSRVHVHSEHCVGFLKGRWSSLRGLRLHIDRPAHIRFATIWVSPCIVLHNFAMLHEAEESDGGDIELNEFFCEGLGLLDEEWRNWEAQDASHENGAVERDADRGHDVDLIRGQLHHEELKKRLFEHLEF
ncbi:hypothetical protein K439DRAFT_1649368 [Ramaria rubella]|nr:hypothetical protein K439DRAFT_1649368 [Ramaria rubella]